MNWQPKIGDLVRYGDGPTALARLLSEHAGGWHAEQCMGGIRFVHDNGWSHRITKPTLEDHEMWLKQEHWRKK